MPSELKSSLMQKVKRGKKIDERRRDNMGGKCCEELESHTTKIALSVGEAEYYAMVSAAAEALGFKSLLRDLGCDAKVRVWTDSAAAKSIGSRRGIGKIRHLDVKYLWIQDMTRRKELQLKKILGSANPADIMTKPKDAKEIGRLTGKVKVNVVERKEGKKAKEKGEEV